MSIKYEVWKNPLHVKEKTQTISRDQNIIDTLKYYFSTIYIVL